MSGLLDKVVVVTGAARGTGRVHCERFADEGADVIALDVAAVAEELPTPQPKSRGRAGDASGVRRRRDLEAMTAGDRRGLSPTGPADVIMANAGIHPPCADVGAHRGGLAAHARRQPHRGVAHREGGGPHLGPRAVRS